jgi:hypothetical protein
MNDKMTRNPLTRRAALGLAATTAGAFTILAVKPAQADGQLSKAAVGYQDVPENGKVCAACIYFEFAPATGSTPASHCKLVGGLISPSGWCEVWAPKS